MPETTPIEVLSTVPFRFKDVHSCDAIVAMPFSFNFNREALACVEDSLGIRAFDLFGIQAFSQNLARDSKTVVSTLDLASKKHLVKKVVLFQHVDFHDNGKSNRFTSQHEEDLFHKTGLFQASKKIKEMHPGIETVMIYARLISNQSEIEFSEIQDCGVERVRMVSPYRFKGIHGCNVAVVMCMDFRYRRESRGCVRYSLKEDVFDLIGFPGSSKRFIEESPSAWKSIKLSYEKHGCRKIIIIHHQDCGAYGGSSLFDSPQSEEWKHKNEMSRFESMLMEKYPDLEVVKVYARMVDNQEKIQFIRF